MCKEILKSEKSYHKHLALTHESYADGTDVKDYTIASLDNKMDLTYLMLLKYEETRVSKDGALLAKVLQHIIKASIWDSNRKKVMVEIDYEKWIHALDQLDDYGRAKENLQKRDKALYHKKIGEEWIPISEHRCILPSPTQLALADASQEAHRKYFSPIRVEQL